MRDPRYLLRLAAACGAMLLTGAARAQDGGEIVVGVTTDSYPFGFRDEAGRLQGFASELLDAVARTEHLRVVRRAAPGLEINARFEKGEFDMLQQFTQTPAREAFAEFSSALLANEACIVVRRGSGIVRPADLAGRRVLYVTQGSPGADFLRDHHIGASWDYVGSVAAGLRAVQAGSADAIFAGRYTALALLHHERLTGLQLMAEPLHGYEIRMCFAVHRGNAELLSRLNEGLNAVERNGQYARIWQTWFGRYEAQLFTRDQVMKAGAALLGVGLLAAIWGLMRQRRLHATLSRQSHEVSEQRALLQALYDHIPTGMTVLEVPREGTPRVISMNREAVRLYGEDSAAHIAVAVDRLRTTERIAHYEWVFPKTRRVFEVTLVRLTTSPSASPRVCVLAEDVTARKHADAEIAQSRKMRAVGELVGGIAHEFNNLLTPILLKVGEIELLHPADPGLASELEVIAGAARRAADLTRRLLTFGRKSEVRSESVRLEAVVDACFHLLRSTVDRRIVWENAVPTSLPPLRFNGTDLNQILINLLLNARDTLMEKLAEPHPALWLPTIRVAASRLAPDALPVRRAGPEGATLAGWQHLTVSDNGMGMPSDVAERIFEPFFTTKDVGQGTGLGLATVWHIITEAGGRIQVESHPGEGTTFHVHLPAWDLAPVTGLSLLKADSAPATGALKVLLVEDDPLVSKAVEAMLARLNHQVQMAADGLEAERRLIAGGRAIDLVILDVNLPGADGPEVARRARAGGYAGRILVMSGRVDETLRAAMGRVGVDRVIAKPFTPGQLDHALRECMVPA